MRQVVGFRDRSTGRGTFGGKFGVHHCNQWGLYGVRVRQCHDAALFPNDFGQTCYIPGTSSSSSASAIPALSPSAAAVSHQHPQSHSVNFQQLINQVLHTPGDLGHRSPQWKL